MPPHPTLDQRAYRVCPSTIDRRGVEPSAGAVARGCRHRHRAGSAASTAEPGRAGADRRSHGRGAAQKRTGGVHPRPAECRRVALGGDRVVSRRRILWACSWSQFARDWRSCPGRLQANLPFDKAFIRVDIPDEPFKHPTSGFTTRETLRLRHVIERQSVLETDDGARERRRSPGR